MRFFTAARAAEECAMPGSPWWGDSVTLTILPPSPLGIIALVATAWLISQVPSTFSRITVRKPLGVMSSAGVRNCLSARVVDQQVDLAVALQHRATRAST